MKKKQDKNKRILLIINPNAGRLKSMRALTDIVDIFGQSGFITTSLSTKSKGHATQLVKDHAKDHDIVVCAGGDGTLNEVIAGLMSLEKDIPIGYIPMGTSNDFAASLGLSTNIKEATQDIIGGKLLSHDIGTFNQDQYFSYIASFGAMTEVAYLTPQKLNNYLGHSAYMLDAARHIFKIKAFRVKLEFEDKVYEEDILLGGITNSRKVAGLVKLRDNEISLNDGIYEVIFFKKPKNMKDLSYTIKWFMDQKPNNPMVIYDRASSFKISSQEYIPWTVDGEFAGYQKEVIIENKVRAVSFLCPEQEK